MARPNFVEKTFSNREIRESSLCQCTIGMPSYMQLTWSMFQTRESQQAACMQHVGAYLPRWHIAVHVYPTYMYTVHAVRMSRDVTGPCTCLWVAYL